MEASETGTCRPFQSKRLTIRGLLMWMVFVAVPLASFRQYYAIVSDTADQRILRLFEATPVAQLFFALGVLSVVAIGASYFWQRKHFTATAVLIALVLSLSAGSWLNASLFGPSTRSVHVAQLHNDAASLVAIAVKLYYENNRCWPTGWDDLAECLEKARLAKYSLPGTDSSSIPSSAVVHLASSLSSEELSKIVDIDFQASTEVLAKQSWHQFTGIRPHKPTYNFYRVQFDELIDVIRSE